MAQGSPLGASVAFDAAFAQAESGGENSRSRSGALLPAGLRCCDRAGSAGRIVLRIVGPDESGPASSGKRPAWLRTNRGLCARRPASDPVELYGWQPWGGSHPHQQSRVNGCADSRFLSWVSKERTGWTSNEGQLLLLLEPPSILHIVSVHSFCRCAAARTLSRKPTKARAPRGPRRITSS